MAVSTLEGEKIGSKKIKCKRFFLLGKSHKFQNLFKVNKYSKTTKYCILFVPE